MILRRTWSSGGVLVLILAGAALMARADHVTLKDGTTIDGIVIPQGDKYWIKTPDGATQTIPKSSVESVTKGTGAPAAGSEKAGATAAIAHTPAPPQVTGGALFAATQRKAMNVSTALAAVTVWQRFIDENPKDPDLAAAKAEIERWQKLADDGAERINGRWIAGAERKALVEKAGKLTKEGWEFMMSNQTLAAVKKLEESIRIYPNSFRTNFALGYLNVMSDKNPEAIRFFENALRLNPKSPETLNNMGVAYMRQRQYVDGINYLYKAADYGDSAPLCQNLVNGIASLPPVARNTPKIKPAMDAATLLASKYHISGPSGTVIIVGLSPKSEAGREGEGGEDETHGGISAGTGFLINDQGLIVTNRHVVKGARTLLVMMDGRKKASAEIVVIDDEQDLALVKLKAGNQKTPFVHLAANDNPGDGAECTVMGFPLIDRLGGSIKVTRGIVSSGSARQEGADIVTDAKVNPGNSGGPMLDRFGNVMGVVTMKSANSTFEDSYGLAISAGKVRKFLAKNNVAVTAGANGSAGLSAEEIAAKVKPATVCIICTEREKE
ncbi:MAG TPA: trypsin-like peptidase domain-containing protein [Tepidisphaeraceae bacterium]|jgi:tetratricopeptide (TPR) repeat protein